MPTTKSLEEVLRETKIYQILRPKLVMSTSNITVQEAVDLMRTQKSGYVVIAGENSSVQGMFTEREVLMNVLKKGVALSDPVTKYMRTDIHTLTKSDTIGTALTMMNTFNIRHIPLLDEYGQVSGILSVRTIIRYLAELFPTEVFNLPPTADQIHSDIEGG